MTEPEPTAPTATDRYIRTLAAAAHAHDPALRRLSKWQPEGIVDPVVIGLTAEANDEQWISWALTGKLFARWHFGRASVRYGPEGAGLGHALRTIGSPGARGPRNPAALRLLTRLTTVDSDPALSFTVDAIGAALRSSDYPPRWSSVADEIHAWRNPQTRNITRVLWARQFHTYQPAPTSAS